MNEEDVDSDVAEYWLGGFASSEPPAGNVQDAGNTRALAPKTAAALENANDSTLNHDRIAASVRSKALACRDERIAVTMMLTKHVTSWEELEVIMMSRPTALDSQNLSLILHKLATFRKQDRLRGRAPASASDNRATARMHDMLGISSRAQADADERQAAVAYLAWDMLLHRIEAVEARTSRQQGHRGMGKHARALAVALVSLGSMHWLLAHGLPPRERLLPRTLALLKTLASVMDAKQLVMALEALANLEWSRVTDTAGATLAAVNVVADELRARPDQDDLTDTARRVSTALWAFASIGVSIEARRPQLQAMLATVQHALTRESERYTYKAAGRTLVALAKLDVPAAVYTPCAVACADTLAAAISNCPPQPPSAAHTRLRSHHAVAAPLPNSYLSSLATLGLRHERLLAVVCDWTMTHAPNLPPGILCCTLAATAQLDYRDTQLADVVLQQVMPLVRRELAELESIAARSLRGVGAAELSSMSTYAQRSMDAAFRLQSDLNDQRALRRAESDQVGQHEEDASDSSALGTVSDVAADLRDRLRTRGAQRPLTTPQEPVHAIGAQAADGRVAAPSARQCAGKRAADMLAAERGHVDRHPGRASPERAWGGACDPSAQQSLCTADAASIASGTVHAFEDEAHAAWAGMTEDAAEHSEGPQSSRTVAPGLHGPEAVAHTRHGRKAQASLPAAQQQQLAMHLQRDERMDTRSIVRQQRLTDTQGLFDPQLRVRGYRQNAAALAQGLPLSASNISNLMLAIALLHLRRPTEVKQLLLYLVWWRFTGNWVPEWCLTSAFMAQFTISALCTDAVLVFDQGIAKQLGLGSMASDAVRVGFHSWSKMEAAGEGRSEDFGTVRRVQDEVKTLLLQMDPTLQVGCNKLWRGCQVHVLLGRDPNRKCGVFVLEAGRDLCAETITDLGMWRWKRAALRHQRLRVYGISVEAWSAASRAGKLNMLGRVVASLT